MAEYTREEMLPRLLQDAGKVWDAIIFPEPFEMTVDLRKELERRGQQVPREVAIASFNESFATRYGEITVAAQPLEAIAEGAMFLIDSLIHRRFLVSRAVQLRYQPDLIIRSSTQCQ